ncbi:capsular biosynthesis protein [Limosilactobacillus frumenti DSM 13145]|uniref:Capsular biosynthesis protein n=1 Tax=Limosilactobacillus frumenti DSM 13145 TaxID=1423746 RepID=A0A0R1P295_9LACO|nr:DUF4422 domain-containing protein [Limosilactobacillus frumenti]KRL26172.1 capsular biosynthesis protein [Limosilactobacillus frumenti DSM 13145]MBA2914615.1 DUF4422 domain-containing protein [Limosilactobacillus frumenti]QFG72970.1 DUF4422 domain-containing protein [Limosilactobacillus frumenti]
MKVKVLVAAHKNYKMPTDPLYLPVFVGKEIHPDVNHTFQGDNTGDNISSKNPTYNELTAIYWGWKNLDVDAMGLVHYRRYLSLNHRKSLDSVLTEKQVQQLLSNNDIILPPKRRYYIETNESHYLHAHHHEPFNVMRQVIAEKYPEYVSSFNKVMKRTWAHMFNMFIMKKQPLDEYCTWMFDVLSEVEKRIDISTYSTYEKRVYGFLSELLLDVWLDQHSQYQTVEVKYVFMEHTNWFKKGGKFVLRKFTGHA